MRKFCQFALFLNLAVAVSLMQGVEADNTPKRRMITTPAKRGIVTATDEIYWQVYVHPQSEPAKLKLESAIRDLGFDPNSFGDRIHLADEHVEKDNLIAALIDLEAALNIKFELNIRDRIQNLRSQIEHRQSVPIDQAKHVKATFTSGSISGCDRYIYELEEEVKRRWRLHPPCFDEHTILHVVLDQQGSLKKCTIFTSSGLAAVDQSTVNAVHSAAPFGALPQESTELDLTLKFNVGHHQTDRTRPNPNFPGGVYLSAREVAEEGRYPAAAATTYAQKVDQIIRSKWSKKTTRNTKDIVVLIEIAADGKLNKASVHRSCGQLEIDKAALQTVHDCAPFSIPPALPSNMTFDMEYTFPAAKPAKPI